MFCFSNICRLCKESTKTLINIFGNNKKEIFRLIVSYLPELEESELNIAMKHICTNCFEVLRMIDQYKTRCLQSDTIFQNYLKQLSTRGKIGECFIKLYDVKEISIDLIESYNEKNDDSILNLSENNNDQNFNNAVEVNHLIKQEHSSLMDYEIFEYNMDTLEVEIKEENILDHINTEDDTNDDVSTENIQNIVENTKQLKIEIKEENILDPMNMSSNKNNDVIYKAKIKKIVENTKQKRRHKCDVCLKTFYDRSNLNKHIMIHTGEKPFKCNKCDKRFSRKDHLNNHLETHSSTKFYECDICNRFFAQNSGLHKHKRIHANERLHQCDICFKTFYQKSHVLQHKRIHTGEKPFECNICFKKFTENSTLSKHKRIHTGEKPYKCDICSRMFSQSSILNSHIRTIHYS